MDKTTNIQAINKGMLLVINMAKVTSKGMVQAINTEAIFSKDIQVSLKADRAILVKITPDNSILSINHQILLKPIPIKDITQTRDKAIVLTRVSGTNQNQSNQGSSQQQPAQQQQGSSQQQQSSSGHRFF